MTEIRIAGITKSSDDTIYVLSRGHDSIHSYDNNLNPLSTITFDNPKKEDCNFISTSANRLYVSCQTQVFVLNKENGAKITSLKATRGPTAGYNVGVTVDEDLNRIIAVRRGRSQVDVFDGQNFEFRETLGNNIRTLWSDIVVSGQYLYVVDYLSATVKAFEYR